MDVLCRRTLLSGTKWFFPSFTQLPTEGKKCMTCSTAMSCRQQCPARSHGGLRQTCTQQRCRCSQWRRRPKRSRLKWLAVESLCFIRALHRDPWINKVTAKAAQQSFCSEQDGEQDNQLLHLAILKYLANLGEETTFSCHEVWDPRTCGWNPFARFSQASGRPSMNGVATALSQYTKISGASRRPLARFSFLHTASPLAECMDCLIISISFSL